MHIFQDHLLKSANALPLVSTRTDLIWPSVFLLICFALLVLIKVTSFNKVTKLITACFNMQAWRQLEREEFNHFRFYTVLLSIFFFFNLSFIIYKINSLNKLVLTERSPLEQFLFLQLCLASLIGMKAVMNKIISVFSGDSKVIPEFVYSSYVVSQTAGLLLFPLVLVTELGKWQENFFLSIACVVLAASQVYKWYRGTVFTLIEKRVGLLQIFVYFCALEILPPLVVVKFLIENF